MMDKCPFGEEIVSHLSILNPESEMKLDSIQKLAQKYKLVEPENLDCLVEEATDYALALVRNYRSSRKVTELISTGCL